VLGAWRGDSASSARYRLGLKDRVTSIAAHRDWGPALTSTHRRLAAETLALLSAPTAAEGENQPVNARFSGGDLAGALADWQQAASPQRDLAERGSFSALTSFLKLQVGVVAVAASLPDWETAARTLPAFMRTVAAQEQAQDDDGEKAIAEAGGNEEARPWQDKVEAFVALVQTYDATQRAQILEQLDESDAAWVATNLGGHAGA